VPISESFTHLPWRASSVAQPYQRGQSNLYPADAKTGEKKNCWVHVVRGISG